MPSPARVARAVGQLAGTATARGARAYPSPELARDGYVLRPDLLAPTEAALIAAELAYLTDPALTSSGVPGARLRDRADEQVRDLRVRQVGEADRLSPRLRAVHESAALESTMSELTGLDLGLGRLAVQIDWPDTDSKRGLHVDSHYPPTYKAFIYLTPVAEPANGPLSVIAGSHRDRLRKVRAVAGNVVHGRDLTDLDHAYDIAAARCLLGGPGTAIFADQRLAHAGWPGHTTGTRIMLVAYLYSRPAPGRPRPPRVGAATRTARRAASARSR